MQIDALKPILEAFPLFKTMEEKEKFLVVVSALNLRLVSIAKASEIMNMSQNSFLDLLDSLNLEYSYLSEKDIETEKNWPNESSI